MTGATLAFVEMLLRTVCVGHDSVMVIIMEDLLKMMAVALGPNPSNPTNLSVGLDLVPPRLERLRPIERDDDHGARVKVMESMSHAKLPFIMAPNTPAVESIASPEKLEIILLASSFDAKDWK